MKEKGYKKLFVWQKADQLVLEVYKVSQSFPREEQYGITNQLRRAALSIPTNIAEGCGRQGKNETRQFANIALGSLTETEYLLELCQKLGFITPVVYERLESLRSHVGALLWGFYKSF